MKSDKNKKEKKMLKEDKEKEKNIKRGLSNITKNQATCIQLMDNLQKWINSLMAPLYMPYNHDLSSFYF